LVHHAAVPPSPSPFPLPWQLDPDCVHAVRRQQFARIEGGEVDGGDPDRPAPPRPALHHAGRAVAPAEPALRRREIAVGDGGPDQRRGDGLPVVPHGVHYIHREPVFPRQPSHQLHVTRPPATPARASGSSPSGSATATRGPSANSATLPPSPSPSPADTGRP